VKVNVEKKIVMKLSNLKIARDLEVFLYAKILAKVGLGYM
jgi:hypothetical protein